MIKPNATNKQRAPMKKPKAEVPQCLMCSRRGQYPCGTEGVPLCGTHKAVLKRISRGEYPLWSQAKIRYVFGFIILYPGEES